MVPVSFKSFIWHIQLDDMLDYLDGILVLVNGFCGKHFDLELERANPLFYRWNIKFKYPLFLMCS